MNILVIIGVVSAICIILAEFLSPLLVDFIQAKLFPSQAVYEAHIKKLPQKLKTRDWQMRRKALQQLNTSLVKFNDANLLGILAKALKDSSAPVRQEAAKVLKKAETVHAIPLLLDVLATRDRDIQSEAIRSLEPLCLLVNTVVFGHDIPSDFDENHSLLNPEVEKLTVSMKKLRSLVVAADSCDVQQVERFLTYAANNIGQKTLKKQVNVYIYGSPAGFHRNLQNSLANLCRNVVFPNN